jgi:hypothetical protein
VGDVGDRHPARLQSADHGEQALHRFVCEGARRLVHEDHLRVEGEDPRDGDQLPVGDAEVPEEGAWVDGDAGLRKERRHGPGQFAERDPELCFERGVPERDVLGDGEVRKEVQLLEDDADAGAAGLVGPRPCDGAAAEEDLAGVRLRDSREDARQRALARAVLAAEGVHLPGPKLPGDVVQGPNAAVVLGDPCAHERGEAALRFHGGGGNQGVMRVMRGRRSNP